MSDEIQAISQGNYILHNIDAQKLYAQAPLTTGVSGTSAYIGIEPSARYNETVLWSGNLTTAPITLSESMYNFDRIKIFGTLNGSRIVGAPMCWEFETTAIPVGTYLNCNGFMANQASATSTFGAGCYLRNSVEYVSANNKITHAYTQSFTFTTGAQIGFQNTDAWGQLRYDKVIGINKKEV